MQPIELTEREEAAMLAEIEAAEPIAEWTSETVQMAVRLSRGIVEEELSIAAFAESGAAIEDDPTIRLNGDAADLEI